jgi:cyclophilin family peptidyl-prolyl cis-trans isomerase
MKSATCALVLSVQARAFTFNHVHTRTLLRAAEADPNGTYERMVWSRSAAISLALSNSVATIAAASWPARAVADASIATALETSYDVSFMTSEGEIVFKVHPEWGPIGAARFRELVSASFFDDCRFFRVLPGFVAQFGINGDPEVMRSWKAKGSLRDDPVTRTNKRGTLVFATSGANSRTTQLFINTNDNTFLDRCVREHTRRKSECALDR